MAFFKCKHPFKYLHVKNKPIVRYSKDGMHVYVTNRIFCRKCGQNLEMKVAYFTTSFGKGSIEYQLAKIRHLRQMGVRR